MFFWNSDCDNVIEPIYKLENFEEFLDHFYVGKSECYFKGNLKEIMENPADVVHFYHVHRSLELLGTMNDNDIIYRIIDPHIYYFPTFENPSLVWIPNSNDDKKFMASMKVKVGMNFFKFRSEIGSFSFIHNGPTSAFLISKLFNFEIFATMTVISLKNYKKHAYFHVFCSKNFYSRIIAKMIIIFTGKMVRFKNAENIKLKLFKI